jgi:hypothetical protein
MAKANVIYSIEVAGEEKLVEAANRAQGIRAATKPLVGKVKVLTAMELFAKTKEGAEVINAAEVLKSEPAEGDDATGETEEN